MSEIKFDTSKLRGRIYEKYSSVEQFAHVIGMRPATMNYKLRGESPWKIPEAYAIMQALGIPSAEADSYFFTLDTGKSQQGGAA